MNRDKYENLSVEEIMQSADAVAALLQDCLMYREALDAMPEPVVIHDSEKRVIIGNEAQRLQEAALGEYGLGSESRGRSFEETRDALNNSKFVEIIPNVGDLWYERHVEAWNSSLATGQPVERQEISGAWQLYGVKQTPSGYLVDCRMDITKQKELQLQLEEILERTNQGVAIFSGNYKVLHLNPALVNLWGLADFDWRDGSKSIEDFFNHCRKVGTMGAGATEEEWQRIFETATKLGHMDNAEDIKLTLDNGRHIQFTSRKLSNGQFLHLHYDVTEVENQKQALETAMHKAEAAERAKSEFLANMSHEIRTPMNGVMGMAELLLRTELDTKQHSFANTIVKSGEALLTIINDILDFSKIDAGQLTLQPAPFSFSDAVEDVATLISSHAADKGLELAVRLPHNLPKTVVGDVGRIRQIITNLVGNAVKFTDEGHVLIDVLCEESAMDDGETAVELDIRITDTGVGIPQEMCDLIFDKFSQVDGSAARRHEGTGLGLAITSSLVDLMGGQVGVESEVGVGSTFWIKLKLPAELARRELVAPVDVNGARILVVDDNEINRAILIEQLTSWGFVAKAANSGAQGLNFARAGAMLDVPFELAILDYQMPEMTGVELATALRDDPSVTGLATVLLTSVDHVINRDDLEALGVNAFLTKPARSSLLLETIVEGLQARAAQIAASGEPVSQEPIPNLSEATSPPVLLDNTTHTKAAPLSDAFAALSTPAPADAAVEQPVAEPQSAEPVIEVASDDLAGAVPIAEPVAPIDLPASESQEAPEVFDVSETVRSDPATGSAEAAAPIVKSYGAGTPRGIDILVAEDNEINQIVFGQTIKGSTEYSFKVAQNGEEAVELYLKLNPALILMDVSMPVMNGMEATAAIREHEKTTGAHTPIVGVTAHAIQGDREKCLAGGMDDYLSKPISPRMLLEKIDHWMTEAQRKVS